MTATVEELKRAWQAVEAGHFRTSRNPFTAAQDWAPPAGEPVLPVVGAHGNAGASTLALALATVAAPARVVECASAARCGLVAAPTAELGDYDGNWSRGTRGDVLLERLTGVLLEPREVPAPSLPDRASRLTVIDISWDPAQVLAATSWLSAVLLQTPAVVVTAHATIPGLRHLENTLALLPEVDCVAAILGPGRRKWPKVLSHTFGPLTRAADRAQRLLTVPVVPALQVAGVDTSPLPVALLEAAEEILRLAQGTGDTRKEQS